MGAKLLKKISENPRRERGDMSFKIKLKKY
jgi:hypothetical protein